MSSWSMAIRSLRRRKTRTALTVSGIVVGVAMILVLLSLAAGTSAMSAGLLRNLIGAEITVVNGTIPSRGNFSGFGGFGGGGGFRALFGVGNTINQSIANTIGNMTNVTECHRSSLPRAMLTGIMHSCSA